jgi:predicted ATPase
VRYLDLQLGRITVVVGANGCGKTNLYRSMLLIHAAAHGRLARTLLDEGGMPSALWAGPRKEGPVRMKLAFTSGPLSYELELGLPRPDTGFLLDPRVKSETITYAQERGGRLTLLERGTSSVFARDAEGKRVTYPMAMSETESVFSQLREPHRFPQLSALREEVLSWRFYHHFDSGPGSPIRSEQAGIQTPVLSDDGRDLAAALLTIAQIGRGGSLGTHLERAFPGARLDVGGERGRFVVSLEMPGIQRPLAAAELSDGTLRYLCLLAALLSPRPPTLMALNEPETSLHPDLMEPLAELIVEAARDCQIWVTTHSEALAGHLERLAGVEPMRLEKVNGETHVEGRGLI